MVPAGDADVPHRRRVDWGEAVMKLYQDPALLKEYQCKARKTAVEQYSETVVENKYRLFFNRILGDGNEVSSDQ